MQLLDMMLREMKEYDDVPIRSYTGNACPEHLDALEVATEGGRDLSASRLSGLAGRIIRPIADTDERAAIVNGWGEQKLMFAMKVMVRESRTSQQICLITGYTDHVGASNSLKGVLLDEKMCLYFNSVTRIHRGIIDTPRGQRFSTSILKSNQIISKQSNPDFTLARGAQGSMTMRPEDIFSRNTTNSVFAERARREGSMDLRGGYAMGTMKLSNRLNTSPTRYFERSIKALATADSGDGLIDEMQHERDTTKIFKDARGQVREDAITADPVFEELSQDTNIMHDGFITLGELMMMNEDFDFDSIPVYFHEKGTKKNIRGEYTPWTGMDNETVATTMLVNALPMYLINHQLASIHFTATNMNTMGEMVVLADSAFPIEEGPNLRDIVPQFCQRLEREILLDILPYDDCPIDIEVDATTSGETYVKISLDGGQYEEFVFPTFLDSVVPPVITERQDNMDNMAATISSIAESLGHSLNHDDDDDNNRPSRIITDLPGRTGSGRKRSY